MRTNGPIVMPRAGILVLFAGGDGSGYWLGPHGVTKVPPHVPVIRESLQKATTIMTDVVRHPSKSSALARAEQIVKPVLKDIRGVLPLAVKLPPPELEDPVWKVLVLFGGGDAGGYLIDREGHIKPIPPFPREIVKSFKKVETLLAKAPSGTLSMENKEVAAAVETIVQAVTTEQLAGVPA